MWSSVLDRSVKWCVVLRTASSVIRKCKHDGRMLQKSNAGLRLSQRRRRWANRNPTLALVSCAPHTVIVMYNSKFHGHKYARNSVWGTYSYLHDRSEVDWNAINPGSGPWDTPLLLIVDVEHILFPFSARHGSYLHTDISKTITMTLSFALTNRRF